MKYRPGMTERIGLDFYVTIANRIVKARENNGLTQKQLADKLEWNVSKLFQVENVKRRINLDELEELANF